MKGKIRWVKGEKEYLLDDGGTDGFRVVTEEEFLTHFPDRPVGASGGHSPACWPMLSDALAVHPKQIKEAMERDRARGLATEYNPEDGRMILKDRGQRRDVMRSLGIHDNNGGYGD